MASHGAGPPPPGHWPSRFPPSPRKHPQLARLPASVPASSSTGAPAGRRRSQHKRGFAPAYPSVALLEAAAATPPGSPNPQVAAIQSRVAELVRRYDDTLAAEEEGEELQEQGVDGDTTVSDDDGGFAMAPTRWRVGDVLLATHSALARTSTRTEHAMVAEFADDPEVSAAIGGGAQLVGEELELAARQAALRHERLAHIQQALHHVTIGGGAFGDSESDEEDESTSTGKQPLSVRERQMRTTMDALHREKAAVVAQLQEALRVQREAGVASEQQAQELAKAQRSLRTQSEELRLAQEASDKAAEAAHASTASWRDKYQASAKAAAAAEAKVQELEEKVRVQAEELVKHEFVLQAKIQEAERHKESEAARHRAEAAAHAQALAEAEAETKRVKAKALEEKRNAAKAGADMGGTSKEVKALEDKARSLQAALANAESAGQQLQAENAQLEERVRDLQARLSAARKSSRVVEPTAPPATRSSFALRLREASARGLSERKVSASVSAVVALAAHPVSEETTDESLSSDSEEDEDAVVDGSTEDPEDSEVVQDERELNLALQRVVATVFPSRARTAPSVQNDASLDESIARFENPECSPLIAALPAVATSEGKGQGSTDGMVPRSALEELRSAHEKALGALQRQYVDSLVEYKTLVLEQYERRQASERERHRLEIEGLLGLVQTKFHAELARRSEHLRRTKEALKVLYRGLRQHGGGLKSVTIAEEATMPLEFADTTQTTPPLKSLLRAAILAMSSSKKRRQQGANQIAAMYDQLMRPAPDSRTSALAAAMAIHAVIPELDEPGDDSTRSVACQTEEEARVLRPCKSTAAGRSTASSSADSLEGYVLPGTPCFPSRTNLHESQDVQQSSVSQNQLQQSQSHQGLQSKSPQQPPQAPVSLHLVQGAPISTPLVAELRRRLPGLPSGAYYVSAQLRLSLFRELVRFYATLEPPPSPVDEPAESVELRAVEPPTELLGSPRDTPFMRRKAVEALASGARREQRRHRFASGGAAILQTTFVSAAVTTTTMTSVTPGSCR